MRYVKFALLRVRGERGVQGIEILVTFRNDNGEKIRNNNGEKGGIKDKESIQHND